MALIESSKNKMVMFVTTRLKLEEVDYVGPNKMTNDG